VTRLMHLIAVVGSLQSRLRMRRQLEILAESDPDTRALTIMAAIERGEGAPDAVVKGWLARALSAPRGPQWVCDNCHHIHAEWVPACENCNSFDTLSWTTPPEGTNSAPTGLEMLPLIVGALESDSKDKVENGDKDRAEDAVEIVDAELVDTGETEKAAR